MSFLLARRSAPILTTILFTGLMFLGDGRRAALGGQANFRGDMLVDDFNAGTILAFNPATGSYEGVFATMGTQGPAYMAMGPNGNIYVSTYFNGSILEYNGTTGSLVTSFNLQPPGSNPEITGLAFDSQGNLYAADATATNNGTIDEYNATTGAFVKNVVSGLATPRGLAYDNGQLYVTYFGSSLNGGIQSFDLNGNLTNTFGQAPSKYGRLEGLVVGPNGNLFATDGKSSVYEFTPAGAQVGSGPYATDSSIGSTYGAGFGPGGDLYVVDDNGPVYKFDANGNLIGNGPFIPKTGDGYSLNYPVAALYDAAPVPEPGSIIPLLTGLTALFLGKRIVRAL